MLYLPECIRIQSKKQVNEIMNVGLSYTFMHDISGKSCPCRADMHICLHWVNLMVLKVCFGTSWQNEISCIRLAVLAQPIERQGVLMTFLWSALRWGYMVAIMFLVSGPVMSRKTIYMITGIHLTVKTVVQMSDMLLSSYKNTSLTDETIIIYTGTSHCSSIHRMLMEAASRLHTRITLFPIMVILVVIK